MNLTHNIIRIVVLASMALFAFSCSENEMDGSISSDRQTFLQMSLNNFGHETVIDSSRQQNNEN